MLESDIIFKSYKNVTYTIYEAPDELKITKFSTYLSHMIRITFESVQNSFTKITRVDEWIINAFKNVIFNDETFQVLCEQTLYHIKIMNIFIYVK